LDWAQHFPPPAWPGANIFAYSFHSHPKCGKNKKVKFAFMKLYEAEQYVKQKISALYENSEATKIAALAVETVSGLSPSDLKMYKNNVLEVGNFQKLENIIQRLSSHEPIQYIMNKTWFYNLELYVDENVLIPRPETEELVDWIVRDVKNSGKDVFEKRNNEADATTLLKILDVGTGSGCIALALKQTIPRAEVWGCDISDKALNVARRNGSHLNIRVDFQAMNFLVEQQQKQLPTVDIVVSNPPYVLNEEKKNMEPHVVEHEPHSALFVPDNDALVFYKALAHFGHHRLYRGGCIYMEINEAKAKEVIDLFTKEGYTSIEIRRDMQGKERMVKVERG